MSWLILALVLFGSPFEDGNGKPSAKDVERAHQLLNGTWEIVSMVDDGETLGKALVREKLVENGRIIVAGRSFKIVNPETGEERVTPFRVDPSRLPRQIDLTSRNDQPVGGIYKFEGDDLVVCMDQLPDSGHPSEFDASAGSKRTLMHLRMVPKAITVSTAPLVKPAPDSPPAIQTPLKESESRKPTETELLRVRELFAGNWDILSIIDNGDELGPELVRRRFAENGRLRFGTRAFAIVNPKTEERTVSSYRVDPSKTPSEIDVTTQFDTVQKGIYAFEGEKLVICLAKHEDSPRPKDFKASGGSDQMSFQLKLAKPEPTAPAAPPLPTPEEAARRREATIRRMMEGSWTMTDTKGNLTVVFQPDGTYVATRYWSKSAKKLFGPPSDSSRGSWSYGRSILTAMVNATTDARLAGHQINARVQSIGDDTMVVGDPFGMVKTFRKLR